MFVIRCFVRVLSVHMKYLVRVVHPGTCSDAAIDPEVYYPHPYADDQTRLGEGRVEGGG